jgi:hypothetical protein
MEPLVIQRLAMENGNGAVRVRAAFNNMTIRGGSNYTITWIKYVCICPWAPAYGPWPNLRYTPNIRMRRTRKRSWLRHYATIQKVTGSIPDEVTGLFN